VELIVPYRQAQPFGSALPVLLASPIELVSAINMALEIRRAVAEEARLFRPSPWDCNGGRDPQGRFGRGLGLELGA